MKGTVKTPTPAKREPRKALQVQGEQGDKDGYRSFAKLINSPELAAHRVISLTHPKEWADNIDIPILVETLRDQAVAVQGGDLSQAEAMLMNQATALQALFVSLTERATNQTHMPNLESFMRLALRAQSQSRATLETLATIKNPPIVYARQANVTTGPQQVNNGVMPLPRTVENETEQPQLLKGNHELLPDTRAPGTTSRGNQKMEAMGEIHRAQNPRG